jgi:hypothetical protein
MILVLSGRGFNLIAVTYSPGCARMVPPVSRSVSNAACRSSPGFTVMSVPGGVGRPRLGEFLLAYRNRAGRVVEFGAHQLGVHVFFALLAERRSDAAIASAATSCLPSGRDP